MSMAYIDDHLGKHNAFLGRFDKWTAPVPESELTWAKNWLVQHIKNTDFQYIDLLPHHVPKPRTGWCSTSRTPTSSTLTSCPTTCPSLITGTTVSRSSMLALTTSTRFCSTTSGSWAMLPRAQCI